ncbi:hypothetical protein [Methylotuvimicrobium sp. KM1]|uniref:hypothetical protein n=1 Tax=Methylotuvimicrobium sp. KM1 TaxID=3377707 RepID=UPI00384B1BDD
MNEQPLHLALDALLLLGNKHQPEVRVGDLVLIAHGRLHRWRQWGYLSELEQNRYLWLLRYSHLNEINKTRLIKLLTERIKAENSPFEFIGHNESDLTRRYRVLPGKDIEQHVDEIISDLKNLQIANPIIFKKRPGNQFWVRKSFSGKSFKVPVKLVPNSIDAVKIQKASSLKNLSISYVELRDQAENISRLTGQDFYKKRMQIFLDELRCRKNNQKIEDLIFTAGELQMLVAPTGRGKSVLSRVLATLLVKKGFTVTLVLPVIKDVIQEYRQCSKILQKQTPAKVASMLFSSRSLGRIIIDLLRNSLRDPNSNDAQNILETVGYHCALQAYAEEGDEVQFGEEPCRHSRFDCPFLAGCPKFRHQKAALGAQLLIINHHAFLSGRLSLPVQDEESTRINTFFDLVVKRSHFVIVDEIDQLQQVLIDQQVGQIPLTKDKGPTIANKVYRDLTDNGTSVNNYDVIDPLIELDRLPLLLRDALINHRVKWPTNYGIGTVLPAALEQKISHNFKKYLPESEYSNIDKLIDRKSSEPLWDELNLSLNQWLTSNGLTETSEAERKLSVIQSLEKLAPKIAVEKRNKLASLLILHRVLFHLQNLLQDVTYSFGKTDLKESQEATQFYAQLIGYRPWCTSYMGPFGRRHYGFHVASKEQHRQLNVQSLCGDPHLLISEIGNLISRGYGGGARIVLGLSATAYFPGASASDVKGSVRYYQPDDTTDLKLALRLIKSSDSDEMIRISGMGGHNKKELQTRLLTKGLWEQYLSVDIEQLKQKHPDRARVLLVTNSGREARWSANALSQVMGEKHALRRVRYLQNADDKAEKNNGMAISREDLTNFAYGEADILIAPFLSICRGHNILQPGSDKSAIASIYVLVRPVPTLDSPGIALAHVNYSLLNVCTPEMQPLETLEWEQRHAYARLNGFYERIGPFKSLPEDLRMECFCNVLVEMLQLAGRGRRGETPIDVFLVDSAFADSKAGWRELAQTALSTWQTQGKMEEMTRIHGALIHALENFQR